MKYFVVLLAITTAFCSCITTSMLSDKKKLSYIANDTYSFTRAYYGADSLLHIDFLNNNSKRRKTRYYSVAVNVLAAVSEYCKINNGFVTFGGKARRHTGAICAGPMVENCTCPEAVRYGPAILVDFKDMRVTYNAALPPLGNSLPLKGGVAAIDCCLAPGPDDSDDNDGQETQQVNNVTPIYIMPLPAGNAADTNPGFVGVRLRLQNHHSKLALVPFTLLLDVITSPVQLGLLVLNDKLNADTNKSNTNTPNRPAKNKDVKKDKK
jgi:hypothetical protein